MMRGSLDRAPNWASLVTLTDHMGLANANLNLSRYSTALYAVSYDCTGSTT